MRNAILFLLLLFGLPACQQKPAERTAPPLPAATAPKAAAVAAEPTVSQRFSPIISGYWVSADYLKEAARTRSPLAASVHFPDSPVTILIQPASATTDSIKAGLVYNFHEGDELTLLFKKGRTAESLPVRAMPGEDGNAAVELNYQLSPADTMLYYVKYNPKNNHELNRIAYKRIASAAAEKAAEEKQPKESELYRALNRLLVAGAYTGADSLGRPLRVQFLPTGRVAGLPFHTYHVQEDFLGGPHGVDILGFDFGQKNQPDFAANYGRDTLRLYTIQEVMAILPGAQDSTLTLRPGHLVYQLVRVRNP